MTKRKICLSWKIRSPGNLISQRRIRNLSSGSLPSSQKKAADPIYSSKFRETCCSHNPKIGSRTSRSYANGAKLMARDIGLNIPAPSEECDDIYCPFHGTLPVRGQILVGTVVSSKMDNTVVIERQHMKMVPKYQRYEKRRSKIHAHNPPCIGAKIGDIVTIAECRPISKTKSFVVVKAEVPQ